MKATELRIGNLFIEKYTKEIIKVIELRERRITYSGFFIGEWQAEPIPLTEEWLSKFGFITTQWDNFNSYRLLIGDNNYAIVIYSDGKCEAGDIIMTKINYVHQLQNLYFALTGEELTFKSE